MKVLLLPQAQRDLDAIEDPLLGRIARRLEVLVEFPELGARFPGRNADFRSTVVDFFRVVYRLKPGVLQIAYIRDCRRRA